MKIQVLCISDSHKHFSSAIAEYEKRMGKQLEIIMIKPTKHGSRKQIIQEDTKKILSYIASKKIASQYYFLLSKEGKLQTTKELSNKFPLGSVQICIIGGAYGLDEDLLLGHIGGRISLGKHTMAHGLATLVLVEQIYRIHTLHIGKTYHY